MKTGYASSHAATIRQLDHLKPLAIDEIKSARELGVWLAAIETAILKNKDCAPEALKTLKWTWVAKRSAHPEEANVDYGCPTTIEELRDFVENKRFPRCNDNTVAGYLNYYTDGLFKVTKDTLGVEDSSFFKKAERQTAPALKWRATAFTTRMLFSTHIVEEYLVNKVQRGDFENWEDFRKRTLIWNGIDCMEHNYKRPSEFFREVKSVVTESTKTPRKFMSNVQRLESAIRAYTLDKDGVLNTFEGENQECKAAEDKVSPLVWLLIEAIAAVGLDNQKCRMVEDHFCDVAGHDLLPSTVSQYRYKWQQLMQLECRRAKGQMAVRHIAQGQVEANELDEDELEEAWEKAVVEAEQICAVRFQRNNGVKKRSVFNPGKFKSLKKTFGDGDKKIVNSKVCSACTRDSSKANEPVHAYYNCPQRAGASRGAGRGRGGAGNNRRGGRGRGRIANVQPDHSEQLSMADQASVEQYIAERDGYAAEG